MQYFKDAYHFGVMFAMFILLSAGGCASLNKAAPLGDAEARDVFRKVKNNGLQAEAFNLRASLNFSSRSESGRVLLDLWGNFERPVRLDLSLSTGNTVSSWVEDKNRLLAYFPNEGKAYAGKDYHEVSRHLGPDVPFSLKELALLLTGRIGELLPEGYVTVRPIGQGVHEFVFPAGMPVDRLSVTESGVVREISGYDGELWVAELDSWTSVNGEKGGGTYPKYLLMKRASGVQAELRIKDMNPARSAYSDVDMRLVIPEGVQIVETEK